MICPKCGANIADNASFCNFCGEKINPNAGFATQQPDFQQPNFQQSNFQQPNFQQPNFQQGGYQQQGYQQGYQQGGYQQRGFAQGGFAAPIQNRNVATCVLLTIVTCGIYGLYWYFCIINDLNTASGCTDDPGAGKVVLFSILTCGIYGWVWLYKAGEKVDVIKQRTGQAPSNSSLMYILLAIFGLAFVDYCLIQTELNKVATM